jgi:hypothetical protein
MMREATADATAGGKSPALAQPSKGPESPLRVLAENKAPVPVPDTAEDVDFDGAEGTLEFESASSVKQIVEFFRTAMKPLGWREQRSVINKDNMVVLDFVKDTEKLSFTIMQMGPSVHVSARGPALVTQTVDARDTARPNGSAASPDLEVDDAGGLPIPKPHSVSGSERSLFRFGANANVPASLEAVLAFYRRELSKRDWKEQTERAVISKNSAELAFITPDGPAVLKLGRENDETVVTLNVREQDKAMKSNLMPKSGQAMLLFGNMRDKAADITINNKTVKIGAGSGAKGPDGPTLELPPGKYKVALKSAGQPSQNDEVEIGADEIWVVMVGPGGMLAVQGY